MKIFYKKKKGLKREVYFFNRKIISYQRNKNSTGQVIPNHYGERFIYSGDTANELIYELLLKDSPCFITRFGGTELRTIGNFYSNIEDPIISFPTAKEMQVMSGFFTPTDPHLTRFCCESLEAVKNMDLVGVWNFNQTYEKDILCKYNKVGTFVRLGSIGDDVVLSKKPWTRILAGKRVLVIHPFSESIKKQYQKRKLLFENPLTLPDFDLITLKSYNSLGDTTNIDQTFEDWFSALNYMKEQIKNIDFDIALIGCGAYGQLLANYVKMMGKKAVHMGGALQLLFGIKGDRWEKSPAYKGKYDKLFNEHWVKPLPEETPQKVDGFVSFEGEKAYW